MGNNSISQPTDGHGARIVIDQGHHEIHAGKYFTSHLYDADLDNASTLSILMRTPATGEIHMFMAAKSTLPGTIDLQESVSCTGGTTIVAYNNHRQSGYVSTLTLRSDPTVTTAGTVLFQVPLGSTGHPLAIAGGGDGGRPEWILKQSTDYVFKYTSRTEDTLVALIAEWYEES